ncbi:MAG: phycobiliprotein lyase [Pseudanabaenaceae cyanobacterium SKYGB_i_bin29]|nr:phycobiliprotein lyase [Pseudanabaenaceae cyanobacterium SKYG29]MDW8421559.1 phycobiliprotein lyase [Pseudanabaenaceae cyanobacterium SKYGB_i_bin29]
MFQPPKTMMDFFRYSQGVWYTQRSVHHFDLVADQSGESLLYVEVLEAEDERCQAVCAQQGVDPQLAAGGASFMWQEHGKEETPDPEKAAILVDIPQGAHQGKLLRNQGYVEKIPVVSRYWFGEDGILTIETEYETNQGQERCWFLTEDFRVRAITVRLLGGIYMMTYCSERRLPQVKDLQAMVNAHSLT